MNEEVLFTYNTTFNAFIRQRLIKRFPDNAKKLEIITFLFYFRLITIILKDRIQVIKVYSMPFIHFYFYNNVEPELRWYSYLSLNCKVMVWWQS